MSNADKLKTCINAMTDVIHFNCAKFDSGKEHRLKEMAVEL